MRSNQLRCRLWDHKNWDASACDMNDWDCSMQKFFRKPQQSCEKLPREAILTVPPDPLQNDSFCPLFVHFFFCAEGEMSLLTMFLSYFLHGPLTPWKSIFLSFWRKTLTFVNKSGQTHLRCSIVFNVCVTHAVLFLWNDCCAVSWNRSDASAMLEGF